MAKFYLATPIYYVNDVPHIGSAYTTIAADVIARYHKQIGDETYFVTGTDEHGAKIVEAAKKHNEEPKKYADKISEEFKKAWKLLNIDYSRFVRTTDPDHVKTAVEFLQKLYDKGFIDPKPRLYKGFYCIGHEKFMSPEELVDGFCPDHKTKPIEHSEENYYFKLSNLQEKLIKIIESDELRIRPESRKNETLGKLHQGIQDISISRATLSWGIPLPFDIKHTAYVWIEALMFYYTYGKPLGIWPVDLHIIGKDILWFHGIIWPALLLAIGEELPKEIFVHGFFTIDGQKMSKTLGNVIAPSDLVSKFGVDGARYLLLTAFAFGEDGDISGNKFTERYNADLANGLGNLVSRVAKLCESADFVVMGSKERVSGHIVATEGYSEAMQNYRLHEALGLVLDKIGRADKFIDDEKPWEFLKSPSYAGAVKLKEALSHLVYRIQEIAALLEPFMPETAKKIEDQFKGQRIQSGKPLFPRIE